MDKLTTLFCNQVFSGIILNGSGVRCSTHSDLEDLRNSSSAGIVTKSVTLKPRQGNVEPRLHKLDFGSINSMGLPNNGIDYMLRYEYINNPNIFISLAPLSLKELKEMLNRLKTSNYKGFIEINVSCPNLEGSAPIAYQYEYLQKIIELCNNYSLYFQVGYKLPPFLDPSYISLLAKTFNNSQTRFINTSSTLGNGLEINRNTDLPLIKPNNGLGGIGGRYLKPISLGNVYQFRKNLRDDIYIIGTGGIYTGRDVYDYLLSGASLVSVATSFGIEGVKIFDRLNKELIEILNRRNIDNIDKIRGKVISQNG